MNLDHLLAGRRLMTAYVASRIPEEGCRIVAADGPEGEVWAGSELSKVSFADDFATPK